MKLNRVQVVKLSVLDLLSGTPKDVAPAKKQVAKFKIPPSPRRLTPFIWSNEWNSASLFFWAFSSNNLYVILNFMKKMSKPFFLSFVFLMLTIFSANMAYDSCLQKEMDAIFHIDSSQTLQTAKSTDSGLSQQIECRCPCHFFFNPEFFQRLEVSIRFKPLTLAAAEVPEQVSLPSPLKPPVSLL